MIQCIIDGDVAEAGLLLKCPRGGDGAAQQFVMYAIWFQLVFRVDHHT